VDTDATLMERSLCGRPDAFVEIVRRHERAVHAYLARRSGPEAADDLLAEVWLRAFSSRTTFDTQQFTALPWLYGIARNVLRAHWRAAAGDGPPPEPVIDPWDEVAERLDSQAQARSLVPALKALPEVEREVLLLVAWEQLTPAEAAEALGIPQGTARSRLHRARLALRLALDREEDEWLRN
jgi:RNA polymerase sigma factor (sigma-70 family)